MMRMPSMGFEFKIESNPYEFFTCYVFQIYLGKLILLRENPHIREELFEHYKKELENYVI